MELLTNTNPIEMLHETEQPNGSTSRFIEANTKAVSLEHLKNDCIIPVFSKDNESTISHYQFIDTSFRLIQDVFPEFKLRTPEIRVSHVIKGRIPSAIGKPVKELLDHEKTIYYERCAFLINIPQIKQMVNGNQLNLTIGGVRSLSQENLQTKKSLEKFKVFIGFKNLVCTNLCVSTDGLLNEIRLSSIHELESHVGDLIGSYDQEQHLTEMVHMKQQLLTEDQFAHFIGKARMYQYLPVDKKKAIPRLQLNDSQISTVVKDYYKDKHFRRDDKGQIDLWRLYNLFTGANKSSYIDSNLERNVGAYKLIRELGNSMENNLSNWFYN